jgi:hypothetical protein
MKAERSHPLTGSDRVRAVLLWLEQCVLTSAQHAFQHMHAQAWLQHSRLLVLFQWSMM